MKREHHLSAAAKQFNAKLAPKFDGPYIVDKFAGPNVVVLKGARGKTTPAHVSDLKPCEATEPIDTGSATAKTIMPRQEAGFAPRPLGGHGHTSLLAGEDVRSRHISTETTKAKKKNKRQSRCRKAKIHHQKVLEKPPLYRWAPSPWALRNATSAGPG